jgi:hypothetical protein
MAGHGSAAASGQGGTVPVSVAKLAVLVVGATIGFFALPTHSAYAGCPTPATSSAGEKGIFWGITYDANKTLQVPSEGVRDTITIQNTLNMATPDCSYLTPADVCGAPGSTSCLAAAGETARLLLGGQTGYYNEVGFKVHYCGGGYKCVTPFMEVNFNGHPAYQVNFTTLDLTCDGGPFMPLTAGATTRLFHEDMYSDSPGSYRTTNWYACSEADTWHLMTKLGVSDGTLPAGAVWGWGWPEGEVFMRYDTDGTYGDVLDAKHENMKYQPCIGCQPFVYGTGVVCRKDNSDSPVNHPFNGRALADDRSFDIVAHPGGTDCAN